MPQRHGRCFERMATSEDEAHHSIERIVAGLVRKVTSDHFGSRLGELREMIESLWSTHGLELNVVFSGAVLNELLNVFHHDS
jgi:hypothetical protein